MYNDKDVPSIDIVLWFEDDTFKVETVTQVLNILEGAGYAPSKRIYAYENYRNKNGFFKTRIVRPKTSEMNSLKSRDFIIEHYIKREILGIHMGKVSRKNELEEYWLFDWSLSIYKSDLLLEDFSNYENVPPVNILTLSSTYDRLNKESKKEDYLDIFKKLIELLNPISAEIDDMAAGVLKHESVKEFDYYLVQSIAWANYFRKEVCEDIGWETLDSLPIEQKQKLGEGFYFSLSNDLFDARDNSNFKLRKKILRLISKSKYVEYSRLPLWKLKQK